MDITISHTTTQPLFEQIYDQIRDQIRKGSLPPDTPLPSIRTLAKELSVSVITITRAYDELERDGYVHMVAGKGSFVAQQSEAHLREQELGMLQQHLRQALHLASSCGMSTEAVIMLLRMMAAEKP